ncbi:MAG: protein-L-isoaspartate O-methyltransferase [Gammaproteobacteria bacterium]|nr:protein-L-isoaspartate O-methyltransferase [Gammaproteobacteria bacterium]
MIQLNLEQACANMVASQIRPCEVEDEQVLKLMANTPREHFVPEAYRALAFAEFNIPLGNDQIMFIPQIEARLLQALAIRPSDNVLEIGAGSGYLTALLAKSARQGQVCSVDIIDAFVKRAENKLGEMNIDNVSLEAGDGIDGWAKHTQYDVIVLGGSVPVLKPVFQDQLAKGGRLFAVIGEPPAMNARLISRVGTNDWRTEYLFGTELPPLRGAVPPRRFVF